MKHQQQPTDHCAQRNRASAPATALMRRIADCIDATDSAEAPQTTELLSCIKLLSQAVHDSHRARADASVSDSNTQPLRTPPVALPMRIGHFELQRVLGAGGFGLVFLAFDIELHRPVALKIPRPDVSALPGAQERFVREAQAAAVLDHPGIVPVYETGRVGLVWYIAGGYCDGVSLDKWLREVGHPIAPRMAAELTARLAEALSHAHSRGILHRDLKPPNILLETCDLQPHQARGDPACCGQPRITDFGLARRIDDTPLTHSGALLGTTQYMAPEQASGKVREIGVHTDIYSLGVILYEMISGKPPFQGESDAETRRLIENCPPRRLQSADVKVPHDLQTICQKCLEKAPKDRYATAADFAADLQRFLRNEPVLARPIGRCARLARWCTRRPILAALSAALAVVSVSGFVGIVWQWHRAQANLTIARYERQRAEQNLQDAERLLIDLAWLSDEENLWGSRNEYVNETLRGKIRLYADDIASQRPAAATPKSLQAVLHTISAKNSVLLGDADAAERSYRQSTKLWAEALHDRPRQPDHLRALSLALYGSVNLRMEKSAHHDLDTQTALIESLFSDLNLHKDDEAAVKQHFAELLVNLGIAQDRRRNSARALLTLALARVAYHNLAAEFPQARFTVGEATALRELAWRKHRANRNPRQAFGEFQAARQLAENALQLDPDDVFVRIELARTWRAEAMFADKCGFDNAAAHAYEAAIAILEQLAQEDPRRFESRELLGELLCDFARHQLDKGQLATAGTLYARCASVWEQLLSEGPLSKTNRTRLAFAHFRAATAEQQQQRTADAVASFRRSRTLFQQALDEDNPHDNVHIALAECNVCLAKLFALEENTTEAVHCYLQAVKILTPLSKKRPTASKIKQLLDESHKHLREIDSNSAFPQIRS